MPVIAQTNRLLNVTAGPIRDSKIVLRLGWAVKVLAVRVFSIALGPKLWELTEKQVGIAESSAQILKKAALKLGVGASAREYADARDILRSIVPESVHYWIDRLARSSIEEQREAWSYARTLLEETRAQLERLCVDERIHKNEMRGCFLAFAGAVGVIDWYLGDR